MLAVACVSDKRPPRAEVDAIRLAARFRCGTRECDQEGCACDDEGEIEECSSVKQKVAGYTWCALGVRTCVEGEWSACEIERVAQPRKVLSTRLLALGQSESCKGENPCEPGCNWFEDDPVGLDLNPDAGVVAVEAGLLLAEVPNLEGACEAITVTPATTRLEITNTATLGSQQVTFSANITPADCVDAEDERVAWGVDRPDVASISAAGVLTLLQPFAGTLTVSAYAGHLQAHASVEVHLHLEDNGQAPAGASALLNGPGVAPDDVANPLRSAICDVGTDHCQCLVGHSLLRHKAARCPPGDPARSPQSCLHRRCRLVPALPGQCTPTVPRADDRHHRDAAHFVDLEFCRSHRRHDRQAAQRTEHRSSPATSSPRPSSGSISVMPLRSRKCC